jgi:signal transduction histidine kinase/CheY-like chemotaxis protein
LGTLGLGTRQRDRFTPDELDLMQTIANQVAAALERSFLIAKLQARAEALDRSNRIKDEFLAVLSHELRTPMNPILGWSKLLQQGKLDAQKTSTALATIERNAQLQVQLIDDLLDISRILSGKMSLSTSPIDLNAVISAALSTVRLAAEAKSIQIQTIVSPILGVVVGDAGRLQQVVWNLLSNAVKFTQNGGQVTIALSQAENHAQIQITDTGKGIRSDFLPYVFEHFRQEDSATTRKFGGLGLGLAIVRQIVEMHGGTVTVDSPGVGLGATFTVKIPLAPQVTEAPTLNQSPVNESDLSGIHILVVDDQTDSREFIAFVLEQDGAIVRAVASGTEALQAFAQSIPNIIISDIGMPQMDGYMLMRQIRTLGQELGAQIPAIALTAYAGELDQKLAIAAGFQRHLAKPIDPEVLVAIVLELTRKLAHSSSTHAAEY